MVDFAERSKEDDEEEGGATILIDAPEQNVGSRRQTIITNKAKESLMNPERILDSPESGE